MEERKTVVDSGPEVVQGDGNGSWSKLVGTAYKEYEERFGPAVAICLAIENVGSRLGSLEEYFDNANRLSNEAEKKIRALLGVIWPMIEGKIIEEVAKNMKGGA
jgi:hypothetical protein